MAGSPKVIDAIAWKFQTGSQRVYLPGKYGNWRGVHNRLRRWAMDGTWERVFTALMAVAWRGVATRYEMTAVIYLAGLHIAAIFQWSAR